MLGSILITNDQTMCRRKPQAQRMAHSPYVCPEWYTELFPNLRKVIGEMCLGSESLLRA